MDSYKTSLIILFKEQRPYRILKNFFADEKFCVDKNQGKVNANINPIMFVDLYQQLERQCSADEAENIFQMMQNKMKWEHTEEQSVFHLLFAYADDFLENHLHKVYCKYQYLLKWRAVTLELDPDMFLTAFLAKQDMKLGTRRADFSWGSSIKSNNTRLHTMLKQGMADNHFHLKGSAPTFQLSWISLMNDVSSRKLQEFNRVEERLAKDLDGDIDVTNSIAIAGLLRLLLFERIHKIKEEDKDLYSILAEILSSEIKNEEERRQIIEFYAKDIQQIISIYQQRYDCQKLMDYTLLPSVEQADLATGFYVGERNFLYECFQAIYRKDSCLQGYEDLFYAYLILKNRLRAEIIQANGRVGFSNFSKYQDRKGGYLRKKLKKRIESTAVLTTIKEQNIVSLEARIIPQYTKKENAKMLYKLDKAICHAVATDKDNYWNSSLVKSDSTDETSLKIARIIKDDKKINEMKQYKEKFFYVVHFPKKKDKLMGKIAKQKKQELFHLHLETQCRHQKNRKELKKCALAICQLRETNQSIARRIAGIDACSNELVARPEVYAQAFRCLKSHLPYEDRQSLWGKGASLENLRITYHVGEDFLDIVDGLRAIEEARLFLGMTHGDRFGHAIALGIDVKNWYREKNNKVYVSKQDILDNIAWLIHKLKQSDFEDRASTVAKLTMIYNKYYLEIYFPKESRQNLCGYCGGDSDPAIIPPDAYIKAWKLRGDDPELYQMGYREDNLGLTHWDRCAIRNRGEQPDKITCTLYQRYHYDYQVKIAGNEKDVFKIEPYMIPAIEAVQKDLQKEICACGIAIECNPSSNHLISNFKRYDKHPIINMYNLGLTVDPDKIESCPQLFVSINTDDQGVFDTLLENEYALMAIAMEKVKDENGKPIYKQAMIYDWLDKIRKMGIEQSFYSPRLP